MPVVDYLILDDPPHLRGRRCKACSATFLERRNGCSSCGARDFDEVELPRTGTLRAYTVVHRGSFTGQPFVSAVIDLDDGTVVKSNLVDVPPDPEQLVLDGKVELVTFPAGQDSHGTEAVAFGFRPV